MTTLVYSDLTKVMPDLPGRHFDNELFYAHFSYLREELGKDMVFPAHNHAFLTAGIFDVDNDRSENGFLSEYVRQKVADWRLKTPPCSFCGFGVRPEVEDGEVFAFFDYLVENDGAMLLYGSYLEDCSVVRYFENRFFPCPYLYEKEFGGVVKGKFGEREMTITLPVAPPGLGYDFAKVMKDLRHEGIEYRPPETGSAYVAFFKLKELAAFFKLKLEANPFYLLNRESYDWVVPKIKELKRAFKAEDFC